MPAEDVKNARARRRNPLGGVTGADSVIKVERATNLRKQPAQKAGQTASATKTNKEATATWTTIARGA